MPIIQPKPTKDYAIPVAPQVLYCSPDAQENGTGTPQSPMKLSKLSQATREGAVIVLRGGNYQDTLAITKKATIQPYPNEFPIVDGRDVLTGFVQQGANWVKADYSTILPKVPADERDTSASFRAAGNNQQLWLDDRYLDQVETLAELAPNKFYLDSTTNKLYLSDNPTGKTVRAVARQSGIKVSGKAAAGTIIKGVTVIGHANYEVQCEVSDVSVLNCAIGYSSYVNIRPHNATRVKGCLVTGGGKSNVMHGWANADITLDECTITDGNKRRFNPAWGAGNVKFVKTLRATIKNCVIGDNLKTAAVWLDESCVGCKVYGNRIYKANIGAFNEISGRNLFFDNVFEDNNIALMSCASDGTEVENNTFIRNNTDIVAKDDSRVNTKVTPPVPYTQKNMIVRNNYHEGTKKVIISAKAYDKSPSADYFKEIKNNQFVTTVDGTEVAIFTSDRVDKDYLTLQAFKNAFPGVVAQNNSQVDAKPQQKLSAVVSSPELVATLGQPQVVGVVKDDTPTAPVTPPPAYTPLTKAEYDTLQNELSEAYAEIADLENSLTINQDILNTTTAALTEAQQEIAYLKSIAVDTDPEAKPVTVDPTATQLQAKLDAIKQLLLQSDPTIILKIIG